MTRRLDLHATLDLTPLDRSETVAGEPNAGSTALSTIGGTEVGVWEMTPGVATDVEVDEVFVVLSGSASVEFEDGEVLELGPGVAVRLRDGDRTTWTVRETLRKVYVAS